MKKGAIFDMDGLLFDTERIYKDAWIETAKYYGSEYGFEMAEATSGAGEEGCRQAIRQYTPNVDVDEFFMHVVNTAQKTFANGVDMMIGVEDILKFFKDNGVKMAVASSSSMEVILNNLNNADIKKYFDAIICGDDVENGKPAPDIFVKAATKINLSPADCYVFEDSFNGIRGAFKAGCAPIMIPDTTQPTDDIKNICTGIYENLNVAMDAIKRNEI